MSHSAATPPRPPTTKSMKSLHPLAMPAPSTNPASSATSSTISNTWPRLVAKEHVSLSYLPEPEEDCASYTQCTLGDLHANAIKLIYFLVSTCGYKITEENYEKLTKIYSTTTSQLTKKDLDDFKSIIEEMEINPKVELRFIGDMLADRGSNDYFVLIILDSLLRKGVKIKTSLSNHDAESVRATEIKPLEAKNLTACSTMGAEFSSSLLRLQYLVQHGLISLNELQTLYTSYKSTLELIGYSLNDKDNPTEITLFSHASIGLQHIRLLAKISGVTYKDGSAKELANTIDQINAWFQSYKNQDKISSLVTNDGITEIEARNYYEARTASTTTPAPMPAITESNIIPFTLWNRLYEDLERPHQHGDPSHPYFINYVYGHDSAELNTEQHIFPLDNMLGKNYEAKNPNNDYLLASQAELTCIEYSRYTALVSNHPSLSPTATTAVDTSCSASSTTSVSPSISAMAAELRSSAHSNLNSINTGTNKSSETIPPQKELPRLRRGSV